MKKVLLFVAIATLSFSVMASENVVGDNRIECTTSYPRSGEGLGNIIGDLISSQIKAGYPKIISTTATKVGWLDEQSDIGQVAVCVTAAKQ
jgi:hypothetical protein